MITRSRSSRTIIISVSAFTVLIAIFESWHENYDVTKFMVGGDRGDRAKIKSSTSSPPPSSSSLLLLEKRMSTLSTMKHKFSFVHVSKCAGASWIKELRTVLAPNFQPQQPTGYEYGVAYQKQKYWSNVTNRDELKMMTSLKHPRAHVWSQWGQCTFGSNSKRHDQLPYNGTLSNEINFEIWLDHFLNADVVESIVDYNDTQRQQPGFALYDFGCYHPANLQSRVFSYPADVAKPQHFKKSFIPSRFTFEPNITLVRQVRNDMDWISISEFYHESKCLVYHRLNKFNLDTNATTIRSSSSSAESSKDGTSLSNGNITETKISDFLSNYCHCMPLHAASKEISSVNIHTTHFTEGKRSSMTDLDPVLLSKLDKFIRIDTINYREALIEFLLEIASMELELGRRVLCDNTIMRFEPEFEYLNLPGRLSEVYGWAQSSV